MKYKEEMKKEEEIIDIHENNQLRLHQWNNVVTKMKALNQRKEEAHASARNNEMKMWK